MLLRPEEVAPDGTARLAGRRLVHAREVLRAARGDTLRVGVRGGRVGSGVVLALGDDWLELRVVLEAEPPARAAVDLLLAMPRPKALRKVLPAAASLGVRRVVLVNAARVEKSYFDSGVLAEAESLFDLGLEQAGDTRAPELIVRERFRPFVEDESAALFGGASRFVAHPAREAVRPTAPGAAVIAIGPEGGWVQFEVDLMRAHGFTPLSFGPRPLRVEVAVPYALGFLRG